MTNNDTRISQPTRYCTHGYERCVRGADGILRHDAAADAYTASDRKPILGIDRRSGEFVALVPSATVEGKWHITTESSCDCKGFSYRRGCRHIQAVAQQPASSVPLVARLMA